jgi:hypothetical protein
VLVLPPEEHQVASKLAGEVIRDLRGRQILVNRCFTLEGPGFLARLKKGSGLVPVDIPLPQRIANIHPALFESEMDHTTFARFAQEDPSIPILVVRDAEDAGRLGAQVAHLAAAPKLAVDDEVLQRLIGDCLLVVAGNEDASIRRHIEFAAAGSGPRLILLATSLAPAIEKKIRGCGGRSVRISSAAALDARTAALPEIRLTKDLAAVCRKVAWHAAQRDDIALLNREIYLFERGVGWYVADSKKLRRWLNDSFRWWRRKSPDGTTIPVVAGPDIANIIFHDDSFKAALKTRAMLPLED